MNPMRDINTHQLGCTTKVHSQSDNPNSFIKCGQTGCYGVVVTCPDCDRRWRVKNPKGVQYYPEDDYDDGIL